MEHAPVNARPGQSARPHGFTLIEVLVVVVIIAIAGAIIVPQMLNTGSLTVQGASRIIIADLLFAQNEAIAQQRPRRMVFDVTHNRYQITDEKDQVVSVSWKAGSTANYVIDFSKDNRFQGVRLVSADFGGTGGVEFDALGSPDRGGSIVLQAGTVRYRIKVAAITGRVTIAPEAGE